MTYEPRSRLAKLTFANRATAEYIYDDLMRISGIVHKDGSGAVINGLEIARNRAERVTSVVDSAAGGVDQSMSLVLDDWYRTTEATYGGGTTDKFAFDNVDRVTSINGVAASYDSNRPLALSSFNGTDLQYDGGGNMIARGTMSLARDVLGRIVEISRSGTKTGVHGYAANDRVLQMEAEGTLVLYGFNRFEVRDGIAATFTSVNGERVVRHENIGFATSIYGDANGNMKVDAGDAWLATQGTTLSQSHILAAAAERLLVEQEDERTYIHSDHLGSHIAATGADGSVRGRQAFKLFGGLRAGNGYVGAYGFTGQEQDRTTGLIHMMYRDLDPVTGRWDRFDPAFVSVDPDKMTMYGEASTGYAYVANNPGSFQDPSGLVRGIKRGLRKLGKNIGAAAKAIGNKAVYGNFKGPKKKFKPKGKPKMQMNPMNKGVNPMVRKKMAQKLFQVKNDAIMAGHLADNAKFVHGHTQGLDINNMNRNDSIIQKHMAQNQRDKLDMTRKGPYDPQLMQIHEGAITTGNDGEPGGAEGAPDNKNQGANPEDEGVAQTKIILIK